MMDSLLACISVLRQSPTCRPVSRRRDDALIARSPWHSANALSGHLNLWCPESGQKARQQSEARTARQIPACRVSVHRHIFQPVGEPLPGKGDDGLCLGGIGSPEQVAGLVVGELEKFRIPRQRADARRHLAGLSRAEQLPRPAPRKQQVRADQAETGSARRTL